MKIFASKTASAGDAKIYEAVSAGNLRRVLIEHTSMAGLRASAFAQDWLLCMPSLFISGAASTRG
jgi:hypothetical protein